MASSGNFNTNKYSTQYNGTIGFNLSWSITSQSIENNTSTIHWTLKSNGTMSSGYYVKGGPITVTIGGVTVLNITSRINVNGSGGFSRSGDITITHDEGGDKSVSMSVRAALYSSAVNCTGSKTYALDHINRCAIITSATDFNDEGNPTIVYSNPAGTELVRGLQVRLYWLKADGVTEETTTWISSLNDEGGTYTFNLNSYRTALRAACPNSNTLPVTVELRSYMYSGGAATDYYDTKVITMSIVNANPTAGVVTFTENNYSVYNITRNYQTIVQGQSTLRIRSELSIAKKSASITSCSLNFNGVNTDITSNRYLDIIKPTYSGTYTATVTITDSRGNTSTASVNIPITPWSQPTAQITLERVNGFETNTTLTVDGTISTVPGSTMSISERHRIVNGTWSSSSSVADNTPTTLSLDNTNEWEVEVTVSDSFTSNPDISSTPTVYILTVGKGIPIMFIDTEMNSLGINTFPDEDEQLYVEGNIKLTGDLNGADMNYFSTEVLSECVTKKSGSFNVTAAVFKKWGMMCQLFITIRTSASIAAGANLDMNFGSVLANYLPSHTVYSTEYDAQRLIGAAIIPADSIVRIRNSNTVVNSGVSIDECFTWIL